MNHFPDEIFLEDPFDGHVHFRQEEMLRNIAPLTSETFAGAMAMPNTDPPIITWTGLRTYREAVEAVTGGHNFKPFS